MESQKNLNFLVLKILAPILILIGVAGYLLPHEYNLMSNENCYNLFHINAGIIGMIFLFTGNLGMVRGFNIGFGAMDIYQVFASYFGFFPEDLFKYTITDDILNIDVGIVLLIIGVIANNTIDATDECQQPA